MKKLEKLIQSGEKLLIPYITPDFPFKGVTEQLVPKLESIGIKVIELGIPFSDPLADGPTIQQSSMVAIENGCTLTRVLELAGWISENTSVAVVLMGYVNPLLQFGLERFYKTAAEKGVQGLIIPDIPLDEAEPHVKLGKQYGIANIFLVAPTTKSERISKISDNSTLFSYCVSMNGVTGNQALNTDFLRTNLANVAKFHSKPYVVGFGLSQPSDIRAVLSLAQGAVVGSALIKVMAGAKTTDAAVEAGVQFLTPLAGVLNEFR